MIHFLYGPNNYVLKAERRRLTDEFIRQYGEHGVEVVEGEDIAPAELRQLLHAGSLFTPDRLIILNQPGAQKRLWEVLGDEVPAIPEQTDLIVVEPSPDKRTRTFKVLQQQARVVEAKELDPPRLVTWAMEEAGRRGAGLDRKTATFLVGRVGADQSRLHNELSKLALYGNIDQELIRSLVEAEPQATVFELLDAVLNKRADTTAKLLRELQAGEDPYRTFGLISSQAHTLALLVAGRPAKKSPQQIAADSGTHPFILRKLEKVASGTGWPEVRRVIDVLAELDDALKTSGSDPWLLTESALMRIANR